ncbi:citrate synthase [Auraticoccus monumenti]|uniref:citrate synthase (unknown stereospecificity) n=1 Tax=Auraticoccus monumenti TaxID=675864 RepID=A0A1G6UXQ7_9ACTN|nr:citrate synthase [Auraticoccus monumenti]
MQIDGVDHLSSSQVARRLGVRLETVYAYASRGVLHRRRLPGRRESYFALAEVETLTRGSGGGRRRPPGLSDDVRTAITLIEHDRLSYRGQDACQLAATTSFEDVVALLWRTPPRFEVDAEEVELARRLLALLPPAASSSDRLRVVTSVCAAGSPTRHDLDPAAVTDAVARLLATSVATLPAASRPTGPAVDTDRPTSTPERPGPRAGPGPAAQPDHDAGAPEDAGPDRDAPDLSTSRTGSARTAPTTPVRVDVPSALARALGVGEVGWVEQALVLLADHDMAASTTAGRVAASVRADPYAAVTAAAAAFDSPRHGTAGRRVHRLLTALAEDPATTIAQCLDDASVPGFGHVVYADRDPRAELLIERLDQLVDHPLLAAVELLSDRLWQRRGLPRTVDLALALGAHVLGGDARLPETLFLHARMVGWTAHLVEEYAEPPLRFRLTGVYTGPRPT